ncbi:MAG: sodium pump decarboxylase subunit gamma [Clostridiales bacterium]|nr:sodium pump decarboxylase subunit gamma [Clostridiales bacterium]
MQSEEIIAVIAAAVAASLDSSVTKLIVRSIKPIPTLTPVWNRAARYDLTRVIL